MWASSNLKQLKVGLHTTMCTPWGMTLSVRGVFMSEVTTVQLQRDKLLHTNCVCWAARKATLQSINYHT